MSKILSRIVSYDAKSFQFNHLYKSVRGKKEKNLSRKKLKLLAEKQKQYLAKRVVADPNKLDSAQKESYMLNLELAKITRHTSADLYNVQLKLEKKAKKAARKSQKSAERKVRMTVNQNKIKKKVQQAASKFYPDDIDIQEFVIRRMVRIMDMTDAYDDISKSVFDMENIVKPYNLRPIQFDEDRELLILLKNNYIYAQKAIDLLDQISELKQLSELNEEAILADKATLTEQDNKDESLTEEELKSKGNKSKQNSQIKAAANYKEKMEKLMKEESIKWIEELAIAESQSDISNKLWHQSLRLNPTLIRSLFNDYLKGVYYNFNVIRDPQYLSKQTFDTVLEDYENNLLDQAMIEGYVPREKIVRNSFLDMLKKKQTELGNTADEKFVWIPHDSCYVRYPQRIASTLPHLSMEDMEEPAEPINAKVESLLRTRYTYYDGKKWVETDYEEEKYKKEVNKLKKFGYYVPSEPSTYVDRFHEVVEDVYYNKNLHLKIYAKDENTNKLKLEYQKWLYVNNIKPRRDMNVLYYTIMKKVLKPYCDYYGTGSILDSFLMIRKYPKIKALLVNALKREYERNPQPFLDYFNSIQYSNDAKNTHPTDNESTKRSEKQVEHPLHDLYIKLVTKDI